MFSASLAAETIKLLRSFGAGGFRVEKVEGHDGRVGGEEVSPRIRGSEIVPAERGRSVYRNETFRCPTSFLPVSIWNADVNDGIDSSGGRVTSYGFCTFVR